MGYDTTFTGEVTVTPPLTPSERRYLNRYADRRHERRPNGEPGYYCHWVSTFDGTALVWNGREKFYDASTWMRLLIAKFLGPGSTAGPGSMLHNHVLNGSISAIGQDGAEWTIDVVENVVTASEVSGPRPPAFQVVLLPRGQDLHLDREYDAAFDLGLNTMLKIRPGDDRIPGLVAWCFTRLPFTAKSDWKSVTVSGPFGVEVEITADSIFISVDARSAGCDADAAFRATIDVVATLADELGWIAYDPDLRVAVRPGPDYRRRVVSRLTGFLEEPDAWIRSAM